MDPGRPVALIDLLHLLSSQEAPMENSKSLGFRPQTELSSPFSTIFPSLSLSSFLSLPALPIRCLVISNSGGSPPLTLVPYTGLLPARTELVLEFSLDLALGSSGRGRRALSGQHTDLTAPESHASYFRRGNQGRQRR